MNPSITLLTLPLESNLAALCLEEVLPPALLLLFSKALVQGDLVVITSAPELSNGSIRVTLYKCVNYLLVKIKYRR